MRYEIQRASGRKVTAEQLRGFEVDTHLAENGCARVFVNLSTMDELDKLSRAVRERLLFDYFDGITIEDYSIAEDLAEELNWWVGEMHPSSDVCDYADHYAAALALIAKVEGR